jgi:hypothetical protein
VLAVSTMYEIVLRFADHDEVRVTDRRVQIGERLTIDGSSWVVRSVERPRNPLAILSYICRPSSGDA